MEPSLKSVGSSLQDGAKRIKRPSSLVLAVAGIVAAVLMSAGCASIAQPLSATGEGNPPPNFLVIVADDLGWSDLGSFGGEISTPNLDALAMSGVRFTGFHTAPACSPTRAMLMSGVDHHQAGLGTMAEFSNEVTRGHPGYETYLNDRVASVAELLHSDGYRTMMAGKWHLGLTPDREPAARGFERSFALLDGGANHFGADQGQAWRSAGFAPSYRENGIPTTFPRGAYSSDYFVDRLVEFLREGKGTNDRRPFFAYLAFTAPHWPLQAPESSIRKYKGRYADGYEALRAARIAKQKQLGLLPENAIPHPAEIAKPWASLSAREKAIEMRKMEVYAAMVDHMDQAIGRLIAELKSSGQYDNTLILFFSDNGPDGGARTTPDYIKNLPPDPELGVDNRLQNIGRPSSFVGYGPGWALAASAPSWLMKGFVAEGGIRNVAFAAGNMIDGRGRIVDANIDVRDIAPTLLDFAGTSQPSEFAGRPILPFHGLSVRSLLDGNAKTVRSPDEPLGYELFFGRALRKGDWKAVYLPTLAGMGPIGSVGTDRWQLFHVGRDPGETQDLADTEPARLAELIKDYEDYARANGVVPLPSVAPSPGSNDET